MSGIYIPGERIPDTLTAFWIFPDGYVRVFGKNGDEIRGREAIPVPDHGRLIDANKLFKEMEREYWFDNADWDKAEDLVIAAPTVIPAEEGQ